ncbi:MAG TPA: hypothetical protein VFF90_12550 [Saprospiraceae bacterium]|nr:hypothetical protein [Saprospiraceae bacterium]
MKLITEAKMIFTILLLLHFFDLNPHSIRANTLNQPNSKRHEIQGTWKTASPGRLYEPNYTIIIDKRELFIMYNQGSDGYKQLLTYKIEGHNVIAKEKEIIFFNQNAGNIIAHYKNRSNKIHLVWDQDITPPTLVLEPVKPGSVLLKDSENTEIKFKAKDEFNRLKKCPQFKSDY